MPLLYEKRGFIVNGQFWISPKPSSFVGLNKEVMDPDSASRLWASFRSRTLRESFEKCINFARDIGIRHPSSFCGTVYLLAMNEFPNFIVPTEVQEDRVFGSFKEFVSRLYTDHEENPRPAGFYVKHLGISREDMLAGIKNALKFAKDTGDLIMLLDSISPEFGKRVFGVFVNEKAGNEGLEVFVHDIPLYEPGEIKEFLALQKTPVKKG